MFFREWFAVICVLCFMVTLLFVEVFPSKQPNFLCKPVCFLKVQVVVSGAVESPGTYEVDLGSSVSSVLNRARLKKTADKRSLYLRKKILSSCSLTVPEKNVKKTREKRRVQVG